MPRSIRRMHHAQNRTRRAVTLLIAATLALANMGCPSKPLPNPRPIVSDTPAELPILDGQLTFTLPISIRGSTARLVPFRIEIPEEPGSARDPFMRRGVPRFTASGSFRMPSHTFRPREMMHNALYIQPVRWHNVAFLQDEPPHETTLLLHHRGVISQWAVLGDEVEGSTERHPRWRVDALLFEVTEADTDGDGRLTIYDARRLYLTDSQGRNPIAITPPEHNASGWRYDRHRQILTIEIQEDRAEDGTFLQAGRRTILSTSVINPALAVPLIDPRTAEQSARLLTEPRQ